MTKTEPTSANTLATLDQATTGYQDASAALDAAQAAVTTAIVAALRAGATPTEVADRSPFTAAYVRKLAREHGIPPGRPGVKPSKKGTGK